MSSKRMLSVLERLPLLFVVDSISKGTFLNFTFDFLGISEDYLPATTHENGAYFSNLFYSYALGFLLFLIAIVALVLVFSPVTFVLESYGCALGAALTWLSYICNKRFVGWDTPVQVTTLHNDTPAAAVVLEQTVSTSILRAVSNLTIQLLIMFGFDQICVAGILNKKKTWILNNRRPIDTILFISFSLPVFLSSFLSSHSIIYRLSPLLSLTLPIGVLLKYNFCVLSALLHETVIPGIRYMKIGIRELGLDGLIMQFMEEANIGSLLRSFFAVQLLCQIITSKTLEESDEVTNMETINLLVLEVLHNMCGTLISVMGLASIISIISGFCLSWVYKLIQGNEEEDNLQPVISGFLFVLLAMQTGITDVTDKARLQLLFQNSILLVVANQHFVQSVAADLLIKASTEDSSWGKHVRPLLPFCFFFSFPYFVVLPLWEYPFRLSWLLAITAFSIELIIKSLTTLFVYVINLLHSHSDLLGESTDVFLFYTQAVCGCLEFICGVFLFINGAYIFFFESGGFIRLFMMTIHFICNIYQRAIKGWASYKLRISSREKVNRLRAATQEELDDREICSICYQDMTEAVVLDCNHIFHKLCLQKWLSIQDTCPLCHEKLKEKSEQQQQQQAGYL